MKDPIKKVLCMLVAISILGLMAIGLEAEFLFTIKHPVELSY